MQAQMHALTRTYIHAHTHANAHTHDLLLRAFVVVDSFLVVLRHLHVAL